MKNCFAVIWLVLNWLLRLALLPLWLWDVYHGRLTPAFFLVAMVYLLLYAVQNAVEEWRGANEAVQ
jgi:hypothetical protein